MFDFRISLHYSTLSVAFYVILGCIGMLCLYRAKTSEIKNGKEVSCRNKFLFVWWFVWVFFAVFRLVNSYVGGTDAPAYIDYFDNCNGATIRSWYEHVEGDKLFKWISKFCRFISAEYRFFFFVLYGFMAFAYINFIKKYTPSKTNFVPFILTFYLFLRSYNTIRSNLAIALICLGCTFIIEKKWQYVYLIGFSAVLVHKSAIIYAMGIPFCHFFLERKLSLKTAIILVLGMSLVGRMLQSYFIQYAMVNELNGAYASYAQRSLGKSFFDNAWKIAFEQIALALVMFFTQKKIFCGHSERHCIGLKIVWTLCIYDFMLIPINFIIGSWRGYEFFYLARIIMWGECLYQVAKNFSTRSKICYNIFLFVVFAGWLVFRINHTWEDSRLLPYIFEPLLLIR